MPRLAVIEISEKEETAHERVGNTDSGVEKGWIEGSVRTNHFALVLDQPTELGENFVHIRHLVLLSEWSD